MTKWANTLLDERTQKLVKGMMEKSRQEQDVRKSLILGGTAIVLADSAQMMAYKQDYVRLHEQLRVLRQNLEKILETEATADERIKLLEEVLTRGIPGDTSVKKALAELGRWN